MFDFVKKNVFFAKQISCDIKTSSYKKYICLFRSELETSSYSLKIVHGNYTRKSSMFDFWIMCNIRHTY